MNIRPEDYDLNLVKGKSYDLVLKVNRRDIQMIGESKTGNSIKVCCNYRMKGEERWKPLYNWIAKKDILAVTELEK